jgi:hypothetical protein
LKSRFAIIAMTIRRHAVEAEGLLLGERLIEA